MSSQGEFDLADWRVIDTKAGKRPGGLASRRWQWFPGTVGIVPVRGTAGIAEEVAGDRVNSPPVREP
jgi:hypothetical protein